MDEAVTESKSQVFRLDQFEGPLDLLLFLIKKAEVNIYDIPVAQITEQYLTYLNLAADKNLDNLTDFYLMASTLLYIKSKMLLPFEADLDDEYDDPRRELVEKLIEYQKFKKLSVLMEEKEKESEWVVERKKHQRILPFGEEIWEEIDVWDLVKAFSDILSQFPTERIISLHEEVTINEKVTLMNELLEERSEILFTDLLKKETTIMDVICAFLAILDSVKNKLIRIYQNRLFGTSVWSN